MNAPDCIAVFEISGKMAHFRKFHTNSSSLTYLLPPRTTQSGIVAAILGLERDSYYEELGPQRSWLTVSLRTRVRTVMQTMNNLFVKSPSDFSGVSGHTQVPTELVVPLARDGTITYRVYFSHLDNAVVNELADRVSRSEPAYPISLGTGPMLASLNRVAVLRAEQIERIPAGEDISVVTPCLMDAVDRLAAGGGRVENSRVEVVKDLMPYSFGPGRTDGWNREFLFERQGKPLALRLKCPALRLAYEDGRVEVIVFSEDGDLS